MHNYVSAIRTFVTNLINPVQVLPSREAYELWAPSYDDRENNAVLASEEQIVLPALDRVQLQDKRIIDFGCGTGRHLVHCLHRNARSILGTDSSEAMLSEARKKTRNAKVQLVQSQLDALPIANSQFDVGIASLVLSHLQFLGPPLGEMARVLTIGATLLVTDVHWQFKERGWQRTFRPRSSSSKRIAPESHYHSLTDYQNAFAQSGFTIDTLSEPGIDPSLRNYFERSNMIQVYDRYLGKPLLVFFEVTKR